MEDELSERQLPAFGAGQRDDLSGRRRRHFHVAFLADQSAHELKTESGAVGIGGVEQLGPGAGNGIFSRRKSRRLMVRRMMLLLLWHMLLLVGMMLGSGWSRVEGRSEKSGRGFAGRKRAAGENSG